MNFLKRISFKWTKAIGGKIIACLKKSEEAICAKPFELMNILLTITGLVCTIFIACSANKLAIEANEQSSKSLPIKYIVALPDVLSFTLDLNNLKEPIESDIIVIPQQGYIKDIVLIENDKQGILLRTLDLIEDNETSSFGVSQCKMFSTAMDENGICFNYCFFYIVGGDGTKHLDCAYINVSLDYGIRGVGEFQTLRKIDLLSSNDSQNPAMQEMKNNYKEMLIKIDNLPADSFEN